MRIRSIALVVLLPFALAACGSSDSSAPGDSDGSGSDKTEETKPKDYEDFTASMEVQVDALDNNFKPENIEVVKGTTVLFRNDGRNTHNVLPTEDGEFAEIPSEDFEPGDEGLVVFDETGDFNYYCSLHATKTKGMIGSVRVVE